MTRVEVAEVLAEYGEDAWSWSWDCCDLPDCRCVERDYCRICVPTCAPWLFSCAHPNAPWYHGFAAVPPAPKLWFGFAVGALADA